MPLKQHRLSLQAQLEIRAVADFHRRSALCGNWLPRWGYHVLLEKSTRCAKLIHMTVSLHGKDKNWQWRFMSHEQTFNDAQKPHLENEFWIQDNIFLDQDSNYFMLSGSAPTLSLFVQPHSVNSAKKM